MDIIELATQLAEELQKTDTYKNLDAARKLNDMDEELQKQIGDFNLARIAANSLINAGEQDEAKLEEERRLMYVGITRAQRSLHISYAEKRKQGRELIPCEPSRFINEMGREDLRFSGGKADAVPDKATGAARLEAMRAMLAGK